ncbi:hypothetical protein [Novipirellula galeiformis]|nr:hypothetical protein [Novipirellula galeiformis]
MLKRTVSMLTRLIARSESIRESSTTCDALDVREYRDAEYEYGRPREPWHALQGGLHGFCSGESFVRPPAISDVLELKHSCSYSGVSRYSYSYSKPPRSFRINRESSATCDALDVREYRDAEYDYGRPREPWHALQGGLHGF